MRMRAHLANFVDPNIQMSWGSNGEGGVTIPDRAIEGGRERSGFCQIEGRKGAGVCVGLSIIVHIPAQLCSEYSLESTPLQPTHRFSRAPHSMAARAQFGSKRPRSQIWNQYPRRITCAKVHRGQRRDDPDRDEVCGFYQDSERTKMDHISTAVKHSCCSTHGNTRYRP